MGEFIKHIRCRYHLDTHPSMAIYKDKRGFTFYCFSCHRYGKYEEKGEPVISSKKAKDSITFGSLLSSGIKFLQDRQINLTLAKSYGVKQGKDKLYLPCYDISLKPIGAQVRNLKGNFKYYTIDKPSYSFISYSLFRPDKPAILVESILDALSIISRFSSFQAFSMLGTRLSRPLKEVLGLVDSIYVILDPDALEWGVVLVDYLRLYFPDKYVKLVELDTTPYKAKTKALEEVLKLQ